MFLPVLLVRDFGLTGLIIFAVPNVLGAAAMGWVLARPGASEAFIERHALACRAFSIITIAFQISFLVWMVGLFGLSANVTMLVLLASVGLIAAAAMTPKADPWLACGIIALSLWTLVRVAIGGDEPAMPRASLISPGSLDARGLLWLTPVVIFGFSLCPYLDLTFHRARQAVPGQAGTAAFTLGFGVLFAAMLVLTLLFVPMFLGRSDGGAVRLPVSMIAAHIAVQALATIHFHARHLPRITDPGPARARAARLLAVLVVLVIAFAPAFLASRPAIHGLSPGEAFYRGMMVFFGLIFPAYVWLCAIPTRDGHAGLAGRQGRIKAIIFIVAIVAALPVYYLGFLARDSIYLVPGLAVVLAARFILPRAPIDSSRRPS